MPPSVCVAKLVEADPDYEGVGQLAKHLGSDHNWVSRLIWIDDKKLHWHWHSLIHGPNQHSFFCHSWMMVELWNMFVHFRPTVQAAWLNVALTVFWTLLDWCTCWLMLPVFVRVFPIDCWFTQIIVILYSLATDFLGPVASPSAGQAEGQGLLASWFWLPLHWIEHNHLQQTIIFDGFNST